jgi:hypothetical protein
MPVIRHQTVREQSHRVPLQAVGENHQERGIVTAFPEERRPAGASVDDVKEPWTQRRPRTSRHERASASSKRDAGAVRRGMASLASWRPVPLLG